MLRAAFFALVSLMFCVHWLLADPGPQQSPGGPIMLVTWLAAAAVALARPRRRDAFLTQEVRIP